MFDGKPEKVLRWIRNRARRIRQQRKGTDTRKTIILFENMINQFLREHAEKKEEGKKRERPNKRHPRRKEKKKSQVKQENKSNEK